jgi:thiamine biosynthesis lipoprotein
MQTARVLVPQRIATRAPALGAQVHALQGVTMGTSWSVRVAGPRALVLAPVAQAIQQELDLVVAQMSPWESGSDISRFNRAPAGSWHALPEAFAEVLDCALQVARDSDGACDPTAGALVDAWGFGPRQRHDEPGFVPPGEVAVQAARAVSGWQRLQTGLRGVRQPGGLRLDLSAIAKGYAVDRVVQRLARSFGLDDVLVEVGGELRGEGVKPDGQPWWVALEPVPRWHDGGWQPGADQPPTRVALHGLAIATSGDHRRFFARDDRRYPHTIDPRTGRPIDHGVAVVTVLDASCMRADALSTALTVLGPQAGLPWAAQRGIAALFVTRRADGGLDEHITPAFAALGS